MKEFHNLPILNLQTIDEVVEEHKEYTEIKKLYKHVDRVAQDLVGDCEGSDSDALVDQIFNYYEACKLDMNDPEEGSISNSVEEMRRRE